MERQQRLRAHATLVRPPRAAAALILCGTLDRLGCAAIAEVIAVAAEHALPDLLVDGSGVSVVSTTAPEMLMSYVSGSSRGAG
jgi:anti-anti-sigma regulatory factor